MTTANFPFTPESNPRNQRIASAREIKARIKETRSFLNSTELVSHVNKNGYIYYLQSDNPELFTMLEHCGFFDFHQSNRKKLMVMAHQVSMFVFGSGYKHYLRGHVALKSHVDIHHLDGDVSNNNPKNLRYVSPQLNKLCAQACNTKYFGQVLRKMKEGMLDAANIIALSVRRTSKRLLGRVVNIPAVQWLMSLPYSVKWTTDPVWQPPKHLVIMTAAFRQQ